jgi:hypothetical protein
MDIVPNTTLILAKTLTKNMFRLLDPRRWDQYAVTKVGKQLPAYTA